jgi:hypothetical protein
VVEHRINIGHRNQEHNIVILSTKPRYTDLINRNRRSAVSTWGTTPHSHPLQQTQIHGSHYQEETERSIYLGHHTTQPSSAIDPDTRIALSGRDGAQYLLGAPHHTVILCNRSRYTDRIIRKRRSEVSTWGTTPHSHPLQQTQIHGSHYQEETERSIYLGHHTTQPSSATDPDTQIASSGRRLRLSSIPTI